MIQIPAFIDSNRITRLLPVPVQRRVEAWVENINTVLSVDNPRVMRRMIPSATRGLFLQRGRAGNSTHRASHDTYIDFECTGDRPKLRRLYEKAKLLQWNGADLDWKRSVDPYNPEVPLLSEDFIGWDTLAQFGVVADAKLRREMLHRTTAWMLSQFLHGEQGALMASAQVTEATPDFEGKLFGASQVMDEARHVEVFHRYLDQKLEMHYRINDNLFTIIDNLLVDNRWDMKFLGMQILVEGLALGAFSTLYRMTAEPLLKDMLRRVIQDEARHVNFGLLTLRDLYKNLTERERREREDWAFEIVLLMRNRFLAHELYEEHFAHKLTRRQWNYAMSNSPGMQTFRRVMFTRLVPNLRAIGLLTKRVMPKYARVGLDTYFFHKPTNELSDADLVGGP